MRLIALGLLAVIAAVAAGCRQSESDLFDKLYSSDFGVGIHFESSSADVQALLGLPTGRTTRQSGLSVTEYYLAEGTTALESTTPQLSVTYLQNKLVGVYNRYYPEDDKQPFPSYFVELVPGVKLGNRKSDLVTALGRPANGMEGNEWRVKAEDGRMITVAARFVDVPAVGDELCCALTITLVPAVEQLKGEEYEKQQEIQEKLHGGGKEKKTTEQPPAPAPGP